MDKFEYKSIDWKVPIERSLLIDKNIDNPSLRLYLILLSYARDKITAFPSRETLATDMSCTVRNIDLIKNKLKKLGLLDWETKFNGSNKYNIYKLLQYEPIKKKQYQQHQQKQEPPKEKLNVDSKMKEVIENFKNSYKNFCNHSDEFIKDNITSGWINNPDYQETQGDLRNLKWYVENYGESGLKKLGISFKFLEPYLKDAIEYGDFHTTQGNELIPTISLFVKAKIQHDKIMKFTLEELRRKANEEIVEEVVDYGYG